MYVRSLSIALIRQRQISSRLVTPESPISSQTRLYTIMNLIQLSPDQISNFLLALLFADLIAANHITPYTRNKVLAGQILQLIMPPRLVMVR